jgi:hypothetical protein
MGAMKHKVFLYNKLNIIYIVLFALKAVSVAHSQNVQIDDTLERDSYSHKNLYAYIGGGIGSQKKLFVDYHFQNRFILYSLSLGYDIFQPERNSITVGASMGFVSTDTLPDPSGRFLFSLSGVSQVYYDSSQTVRSSAVFTLNIGRIMSKGFYDDHTIISLGIGARAEPGEWDDASKRRKVHIQPVITIDFTYGFFLTAK